MEILIARRYIPYLKFERYRQLEVVQQGDEIRIYLDVGEPLPTVYIMVETAYEGEREQIRQTLSKQ